MAESKGLAVHGGVLWVWVLAQSPTEKKQGETIISQDTKNKHPLNENNFCGSGYSQFFVRDIEPNLSHARRGEGGRKWDFRWDVGTNNPTRGPRSHTAIGIDPGITPQRARVPKSTWHSGAGLRVGGLPCRNKHRGKQGDFVNWWRREQPIDRERAISTCRLGAVGRADGHWKARWTRNY